MPDPTVPSFTPGEILTAAELNQGFAAVSPSAGPNLTPIASWDTVPSVVQAGSAAPNAALQALADRTETLNPDSQGALGAFTGAESWVVKRAGNWFKAAPAAFGTWLLTVFLAFTQNGAGAIARAIVAKLLDLPATPMDFGAVGDGATLDDAAFAQLAALPAGTAINGAGRTFLLSAPVTFANTVDIKVKVKASPGFPIGGTLLTIAGDNSTIDIETDSNNRCVNGVKITGNDCRGRGVRGKNITGATTATGGGTQSVAFIQSNTGCIFDRIYGENLLVGTADNTSVPRVLSTAACTATKLGAVDGNNTVALWINSTGEVTVDTIYSYECGNNGVYDIAAGSDVKIGYAVFENDLGLNLQWIISEGKVRCETLVGRDSYGFAGVDFTGTLEIGKYCIDNQISGKVAQAIVSRASATNVQVRIGELSGYWTAPQAATGAAVFQYYAGTITDWHVGRVDVKVKIPDGGTRSLLYQTNGTNANSCIDSLSIELIDGTVATGPLTSADVFTWNYPAYSKPSYLNKTNLISSTGTISIGGLAQQNMVPPPGAEILTNGSLTSTVIATTPRRFFIAGVPTVTPLRQGDSFDQKFAQAGGVNFSRYTSSGLVNEPTAQAKNRILNGGMAIDQRNNGAAQTIAAGAALAATVDGWLAYCTGANVTGQRIAGSGSGITAAQYRYQFTGAAGVTAIGFAQRIAAADSFDLNGQTATFSVDLANSLLTSVTWTVYYANSTDTFGTLASPAETQIATGTFTVNSTVSRYAAQIPIPAAATTGIEIRLSVGAQVSGAWTIGNAQCELGNLDTPFERKRNGEVLQDCMRRYQVSTHQNIFCGSVTSGNNYYHSVAYHPPLRAAPSAAPAASLGNSGFSGAPALQTSSSTGARYGAACNSTNVAGFFEYSWTADAEMYS